MAFTYIRDLNEVTVSISSITNVVSRLEVVKWNVDGINGESLCYLHSVPMGVSDLLVAGAGFGIWKVRGLQVGYFGRSHIAFRRLAD